MDKTIKHLMDCLDRIKRKFFKLRILDKDIFDAKANFFVNSKGNSLKDIKMDHVSKAMGIHVTSYSFRDINSTWGSSHESEEIRRLEPSTLQHSALIAFDAYKQNKERDTQVYTQTFMQEEEFYSDKLKELVDEDRRLKKQIAEEAKTTNQEKRYTELKRAKEQSENLLKKYRPLGPKCRIRGETKEKFRDLVLVVTGKDILEVVEVKKVKEWRHWILRVVCMTKGWYFTHGGGLSK